MFTPVVVKSDDNGKPLITYHGTPEEFEEWVSSKIKQTPRPLQHIVDATIAKKHNNLLVIEECPYRSKRKSEGDKIVHIFKNEDGTIEEAGDCGCGLNRCRLGKGERGDGFVSINDCTTCLTEAGILGQELPMPSLSIFQKMKNFGKAATQHIVSGMPEASDSQQNDRLSICGGCQYNNNGTCGVCGCNLKLKIKWADQSCPLKPPKWGPITPNQE